MKHTKSTPEVLYRKNQDSTYKFPVGRGSASQDGNLLWMPSSVPYLRPILVQSSRMIFIAKQHLSTSCDGLPPTSPSLWPRWPQFLGEKKHNIYPHGLQRTPLTEFWSVTYSTKPIVERRGQSVLHDAAVHQHCKHVFRAREPGVGTKQETDTRHPESYVPAYPGLDYFCGAGHGPNWRLSALMTAVTERTQRLKA